jgi:hypothetical protein
VSSKDISTEVRNFIVNHVDSITKLEVLLLLARSPEKQWTAKLVTRELRSNQSAIERHLEALSRIGLLQSEGGGSEKLYHFDAVQPELANVVKELSESFGTYRSRIIELIYNRPIEILEDFANAFRLRKDGDSNDS